jgi:ABC-type Fe3+ transport system substrate-binding protein
VRYLKTNFSKRPEGVGIDLMFGGGLDNFLELAHDGSLEPLELAPEVIDRLPKSLSGVPLVSPHRDWYAAALNTFGILFNKAAIERLALPTPRRWSDLAQPEYFDLVGAGDPRKSGSMHAMYEIILQGAGWDQGWRLIQAIAANVRNFSASGAQVGKDIATGEVVYGLAIDTYASDIIRRVGSERIGFVVPEDFPTFNGDGIAVLKGAPNRELAQAFVEFVLSERGQTLFYASKGHPGGPLEYDLGKLPLIASLYGTVPTRSVLSKSPFMWEGMLRYDAALAGARWNLFNDLFGVFILDLHERMTQQVASLRSHTGAHAVASFPPIPLSEAASRVTYADGRWGRDSAERISALDTWGEQARKALPLPSGSWARAKALPALSFVLILLGIMMRRALR